MAKRAQPQQPDFRLDELLMTRSGIVSILKAMEDGSDRWENEFMISDRHFFVRGVANNGRPHGTDSDVLLAMQTLFWQAGCPTSNAIQTTPYALLTLAGLDTSGRSYQRLREALLRFDGLNWSTRISRKDSTGKFVGHTHTTVLLDELLVSDRSLTPSGDDGELRSSEPIFIRFGHRYAESIREGLHQMLAVEMLAALKQPTARSLYRVLQAHRVQADGSLTQQLDVLLSDWRVACGINATRGDTVRRTLDGAHAHLLTAGYLSHVEYRGEAKDQRVFYQFKAPSANPDLVELLTAMKVSRPVAEALAAEHPDRIAPATARVRQRIQAGYKPRSQSGMVVDAVRNPEKYDVLLAETPSSSAVKAPNAGRVLPKLPNEEAAPMTAEEQVGFIRTMLKVKLSRPMKADAQAALDGLSPQGLGLLAEVARKATGQELVDMARTLLLTEP